MHGLKTIYYTEQQHICTHRWQSKGGRWRGARALQAKIWGRSVPSHFDAKTFAKVTYAKGTLENLTRVASPPTFQDALPPLVHTNTVNIWVNPPSPLGKWRENIPLVFVNHIQS